MTRTTLTAVLTDPKRQEHDRYFWRVLILDESYFQTLVRLHSAKLESRSLTFAQFDAKGKPQVFYDDHLDVLRQSQCFIARKIWPGANYLYASLLQPHHPDAPPNSAEAVPQALTCARTLAQHGRPGLYMQSRFPLEDKRSPITAEKYTVFEGFSDLFDGFAPWLATLAPAPHSEIHGHLFAQEGAEFSGHNAISHACLRSSASLRDNNPTAFFDKFDLERARSTPVFSVRSARRAENRSNVPSRCKCPNLCHYRSPAGAIVSLWPQAVSDLC